jgi:hypothetical protein
MTQEQLREVLAQVRQGIQEAQAEQALIDAVLTESDADFSASVERLARVGL